jgi:ComF family protein
VCARCRAAPPRYNALRSWAAFAGPLRKALHRLKYSRDVSLGEVLARPLISSLTETGWEIHLVTPVPLSPERLAQRGYNQAALLARPLALALGLDYRPSALQKVRETPSQVGLTYEQRRENVEGAFAASSVLVKDRNVLVVDDVTTSGATLDSCARVLLSGGARQVFGLTLTRAI